MLILRDVLSLRAAEVAALLDLSVPAVNSALHRARAAVAHRYAPASAAADRDAARPAGHLRSLLDRYVGAWEAADVAGLVALLRDDAVVAMPPRVVITGRQAIGAFLAESVFVAGLRTRLLPVRANGGPGFVIYSGSGTLAVLRPYAVVLVDVEGSTIARLSAFADRRAIDRFGLPPELAG